MTITINLSPATEDRLRAQAEATGKDLGALVVEAVEARLRTRATEFADILAPVHEDFRKSGMSEAELDSFLQDSMAKDRNERESAPGTSA